MEENMVNDFAETAIDEGVKVYDLVPTESMNVKTGLIVAGVSFVAGVVVTKVAKPVINKVKSIWTKRKVSKDDFEVVEDAEVTEVSEEESEVN